MEANLFHKLEMFIGTLIVLDDYKIVWIDNAPFKTEVDTIRDGLAQINDFLLYDGSTESVTAEKNQVLENMLLSTDTICEAGITNASKIHDDKLMAKFKFTPSDLRRGKEIEIYQRCMNIYDSAKPINEDLIAIGMPNHQLDEQHALCIKLYPLINGPHRVRKGGKSNKEEMIVVYDEIDMIYKERLDNMMKMLKAANSKFYTEYSNSRVIGFWKKKKDVPPTPPTDPTPPTE